MRPSLIYIVNYIFAALVLVFFVAAVFVYTTRNQAVQVPVVAVEWKLSTGSFAPKDKDYNLLGMKSLQLDYSPPKMRIPDLRGVFVFQGINGRPDAADNALFLSFINQDRVLVLKGNEKFYLVLDGDAYMASPGNRPTSLWIEPEIRGKDVSIQVKMKDENGDFLDTPQERASFVLQQKQVSNKPFMIDNFRADATLLARQKVKWSGIDQFLEDHGGIEFAEKQGKQRIQFGEGEDQYAVYVNLGDFLIWKEEKWVVPENNEDTKQFPLMKITKIEERLLGMDLFDVSGRNKILLNLIKWQEPPLTPHLAADAFQFAGARTKVHSMFKVDGKREVVGPNDWFIHTADGLSLIHI